MFVTKFLKAGLLTSLFWSTAYAENTTQVTSPQAIQERSPYDWGWLGSVKLELVQSGPFGKSLEDMEYRLSLDGFNFVGVKEIFPIDPGFAPQNEPRNPERIFETRYVKSEIKGGPVTESHVVSLLTQFQRIDGKLIIKSLMLRDLGKQPI